MGEADPALAGAQDLGREEDDAERDRGVDRTGAAPSTSAERREREREAVGDREGGHGLDQHPGAAHDQQQSEHEQQVIDPEQDVLDAEREIAPGGVRDASRSRRAARRAAPRCRRRRG